MDLVLCNFSMDVLQKQLRYQPTGVIWPLTQKRACQSHVSWKPSWVTSLEMTGPTSIRNSWISRFSWDAEETDSRVINALQIWRQKVVCTAATGATGCSRAAFRFLLCIDTGWLSTWCFHLYLGRCSPSDSHYSQFVHVCPLWTFTIFQQRLQDSAGERKYRGANKGERAERDGTGGCRNGGIPSWNPSLISEFVRSAKNLTNNQMGALTFCFYLQYLQ